MRLDGCGRLPLDMRTGHGDPKERNVIKKRQDAEDNDDWVFIIGDSEELKIWTDAEYITRQIFKRNYAGFLVIEEVAQKLSQTVKREVDLAIATLQLAMREEKRRLEAKAAKSIKSKKDSK
jgi:hypothetical protein